MSRIPTMFNTQPGRVAVPTDIISAPSPGAPQALATGAQALGGALQQLGQKIQQTNDHTEATKLTSEMQVALVAAQDEAAQSEDPAKVLETYTVRAKEIQERFLSASSNPRVRSSVESSFQRLNAVSQINASRSQIARTKVASVISTNEQINQTALQMAREPDLRQKEVLRVGVEETINSNPIFTAEDKTIKLAEFKAEVSLAQLQYTVRNDPAAAKELLAKKEFVLQLLKDGITQQAIDRETAIANGGVENAIKREVFDYNERYGPEATTKALKEKTIAADASSPLREQLRESLEDDLRKDNESGKLMKSMWSRYGGDTSQPVIKDQNAKNKFHHEMMDAGFTFAQSAEFFFKDGEPLPTDLIKNLNTMLEPGTLDLESLSEIYSISDQYNTNDTVRLARSMKKTDMAMAVLGVSRIDDREERSRRLGILGNKNADSLMADGGLLLRGNNKSEDHKDYIEPMDLFSAIRKQLDLPLSIKSINPDQIEDVGNSFLYHYVESVVKYGIEDVDDAGEFATKLAIAEFGSTQVVVRIPENEPTVLQRFEQGPISVAREPILVPARGLNIGSISDDNKVARKMLENGIRDIPLKGNTFGFDDGWFWNGYVGDARVDKHFTYPSEDGVFIPVSDKDGNTIGFIKWDNLEATPISSRGDDVSKFDKLKMVYEANTTVESRSKDFYMDWSASDGVNTVNALPKNRLDMVKSGIAEQSLNLFMVTHNGRRPNRNENRDIVDYNNVLNSIAKSHGFTGGMGTVNE